MSAEEDGVRMTTDLAKTDQQMVYLLVGSHDCSFSYINNEVNES
jgi:hypothetical protein